jgi:hypothetical protein
MKCPTKIDWRRIESFVGYGNVQAPVVFVGLEEGLARPEALRQDLLWRSTFKPVMDVGKAHEGLADGPSLFSDRPRRQPTWRVMADAMLHYDGAIFPDPKDRSLERKLYRRCDLGRGFGDALLVELLPYPNKKKTDWPYSDRFPSREDYIAAILPKRLKLISRVLAGNPRTAIICYGQSAWPSFKQLFPSDAKWKVVSGRYNIFECATWKGAKVTLTYHFSRYFNTDKQLDELSDVALLRRRKARSR